MSKKSKYIAIGKLLYLIIVIIWVLFLTFVYSIAEGITDSIISWMPDTYTVEQDERREMWAGVFHAILLIAVMIIVPVYFSEKIEKFRERIRKKSN